jgi:hypothetical protein
MFLRNAAENMLICGTSRHWQEDTTGGEGDRDQRVVGDIGAKMEHVEFIFTPAVASTCGEATVTHLAVSQ